MYSNSTVSFRVLFHNQYSSNVLMYWVDYNGIKHQYTPYFMPGTILKMDSKYFRPWVFKRSDDQSRLFAFTKGENVSVFDGRNFKIESNSEIHVVINDQGINSFQSRMLNIPSLKTNSKSSTKTISFTIFILLAETCGCMKSGILNGNKNCEIKEDDGNFTIPACYLILPTNCRNTASSTKLIGLQLSPDPCKGNEVRFSKNSIYFST